MPLLWPRSARRADKPEEPFLEDDVLPMPKTIQLVLKLQRPMTCRGDWIYESGRVWLPAEDPSEDEYLPSARHPAEDGYSSGEEWLSDVCLTGLFEEEERDVLPEGQTCQNDSKTPW